MWPSLGLVPSATKSPDFSLPFFDSRERISLALFLLIITAKIQKKVQRPIDWIQTFITFAKI